MRPTNATVESDRNRFSWHVFTFYYVLYVMHLPTISNTLLLPSLGSVSLLANHLPQLKHFGTRLAVIWNNFPSNLNNGTDLERRGAELIHVLANERKLFWPNWTFVLFLQQHSLARGARVVLVPPGLCAKYGQNFTDLAPDRLPVCVHRSAVGSAGTQADSPRTGPRRMAKHLSNWRTKCDYSNYSR